MAQSTELHLIFLQMVSNGFPGEMKNWKHSMLTEQNLASGMIWNSLCVKLSNSTGKLCLQRKTALQDSMSLPNSGYLSGLQEMVCQILQTILFMNYGQMELTW